MKTNLIFLLETNDIEQWTDLPFVPRVGEWLNVQDVLKKDEIEHIKVSAHSWSGIRGKVMSVEYRHDDNDFYVEIIIGCE